MKRNYILGIDTSCDDTCIAVISESGELISNVVSSQIDIHSEYGGVVPELAARKHLEVLPTALVKATEPIDGLENIGAVCVTYGPGLVGSLLCGLSFAKGLSFSLSIPIIGVNHLEGHIFSLNIGRNGPRPPYLIAILTGGHTLIVLVKKMGDYRVIGRTLDDAIGEAFDKVARLLGFSYPGGPHIEKAASEADMAVEFPHPMSGRDTYDMSYSGLKTAVMNYVKKIDKKKLKYEVNMIARGFQESAFDTILTRIRRAVDEFKVKRWGIVGGVIANKRLRELANNLAKDTETELYLPEIEFAGDNGAMIALCGAFNLDRGKKDNLGLATYPNLPLCEKPSEKMFRR